MAEKHLKILGTGSYLPPRKVTNVELEGLVSDFDEGLAGRPFVQWAEEVTGIRERRFVEDETSEDMARHASAAAMEAAGVEKVDFIIACSFTSSMLIPNLACSIGDRLGMKGVGGFVMNTACGGFVTGLSVAYAYINAGIYNTILLVASEALSTTISFADPRTAILFGDGAGAFVVGADESGGMKSPAYACLEYSDHIAFENMGSGGVDEAMSTSDTQYVEKRYIRMPGGPRVLRKAITLMADAAERSLSASEWEQSDVDCLIPHQANSRITWGLADKLGFPREKVLDTIGFHGNTSGASIPLAVDAAVRGLPEAGGVSISRGDKLLMTAVGGGYAIASAVLEF